MGRHRENRTVLPVNQVITPLGKQVELPGLRPQTSALSPDGKWLAVSGKTSKVLIVDPATGEIIQRAAIRVGAEAAPSATSSVDIQDTHVKGQMSYAGLVFSPDGSGLYLSNADGDLKVFEVSPDGTVAMSHAVALPSTKAPARNAEIPASLACSADGKRLYVCGNLSNRLLEIEVATRQMSRTFDVGVAPFGVVIVLSQRTFCFTRQLW